VTLLAARAAGCYPIIITDLIASRLSFAQTLVPTVKTVQIQRGWDEMQTSAEITRMGYEAGLEDSEGKVRVAMECTGFESSIRAAIHVSQNSVYSASS
jgi:L-iditol 2-dehydrogenase